MSETKEVVIVIEPDHDIQTILRDLLQKDGFTVLTYCDEGPVLSVSARILPALVVVGSKISPARRASIEDFYRRYLPATKVVTIEGRPAYLSHETNAR